MGLSELKSQKQIIQREQISSSAFAEFHPALAQIYRNRGVPNSGQLDYSLTNLHHPRGLANLQEAVEMIVDAIQADAQILIVGDYDADGATGCALAYLLLRAFGAHHVAYLCPDRFVFGYGLTAKLVEHFSSTEPDLVITVDNGISSVEGIQLAKNLGMSVIVTDHHLPGAELPIADAIVNPRLPDDQFESKNLAGVGVMFYVMSSVRRQLVQDNWFKTEGIAIPNMAEYLDLVALGTVADVVPLDYNNRILISKGLDRINAGLCRHGIRALLESGGKEIGKIVAEDLAFVVGPRLNAAGRMADIQIGIECLISKDRERVYRLVNQLERLNANRKRTEKDMVKEAEIQVSSSLTDLDSSSKGICLYRTDWHHGIVGLVASRIKDLTDRPTIVFAQDEDGNLRGSGRSIPRVNIRDVLADIAAQQPGLILKFGGHAMAAGLTIKKYDLSQFKLLYGEVLENYCDDDTSKNVILTDGEIPSLDLATAEALQSGGPWGQGFDPPLFDGEFEVLSCEVIKDHHLRLRMRSNRHLKNVNAMFFFYFNQFDSLPKLAAYRVVYQMVVNEFRGRKQLQLFARYMQPC